MWKSVITVVTVGDMRNCSYELLTQGWMLVEEKDVTHVVGYVLAVMYLIKAEKIRMLMMLFFIKETQICLY